MYIGAGLALASAALFFQSVQLLGFAIVFILVTYFFVMWFEEPTLRRMFGQEYEDYCRKIGRWWPGVRNRT